MQPLSCLVRLLLSFLPRELLRDAGYVDAIQFDQPLPVNFNCRARAILAAADISGPDYLAPVLYMRDAFPFVSEWMRQQSPETARLWAAAFMRLRPKDVCDVIDRMLVGEVEIPRHPQDFPRLIGIEMARVRRALAI